MATPADTPAIKSSDAPQAPPSRFVLTNRGGSAMCVPVVNPKTGETQEVFLQPGGKPKLQEGFVADAVFLARNPDVQAVKIS